MRDRTLYLHSLTSNEQEALQGEKAKRFFDSFKMLKSKEFDWKTLVSEQGAFKVDFPTQPEESTQEIADSEGEVRGEIHLFQSVQVTSKSGNGLFYKLPRLPARVGDSRR